MHNLQALAKRINEISTAHGFWPEEGRNFGEMIALAHSELSEALEAHRDGEAPLWFRHNPACAMVSVPAAPFCDCQPKPEGTAVELMDCIIRCLDTLHSLGLGVDIDTVLEAKMKYNESRPHKHGKAY